MGMKFNEDDILRLIRATEYYKEQTGSEWMRDVYEHLSEKLKVYLEQYSTSE